ncbi:hypothetical protein OsI_09333 [Oryza sativa Indica Group]|uniref:Uncharacterized protein n=1 Tax=Oryza sativa subsp. indica TaxID=39946 RepID=A2XAQ2_ORYSI|nr:hypothetical protein OsI_09333 [Oryza sativa Indica Group]
MAEILLGESWRKSCWGREGEKRDVRIGERVRVIARISSPPVPVGGEREAFAGNASNIKDVVGDQEREEHIDELVGYLRRYT